MDGFEVWYQSEHPRVLAACTALSGDLDAASDATDEAFTRALERWQTVSRMVAPGGWVQTVALNHLRRSLRRALRRRVLEGLLGADRRRASALLLAPLPDPQLWMAVRSLSPRQQTAVVLRYVHDLPGVDIAKTMGISPGTVSSTLDAPRRTLRQRLGETISDEETATIVRRQRPDEEPATDEGRAWLT